MRGRLPLDQALRIGSEIAAALDVAHRRGILHRDLKPANVMLTKAGVKLLDFGVARMRPPEHAAVAVLSTVAAEGTPLTDVGTPLGTWQYMPPEQIRGEQVDARADIFALGTVLYEMLAGRPPFAGSTHAELVTAILETDPGSLTDGNAAVMPPLDRIVRTCLAKSPDDRWQSAGDVRRALEVIALPQAVGAVSTPPGPAAWRFQRAWMLGLLVVAAVAGVWLVGTRPSSQVLEVPRLQNARQVTSALGVEAYPSWSPDGQRLAYQSTVGYSTVGTSHVWVTQLGSGEPVNVTREHAGNNRMPSWSPAGSEIAFFSDQGGVWGVYTIPAIDGAARRVLSLPGLSTSSWSAPQWSKDARKLFVSLNQHGENVVVTVDLATLETSRLVLPPHEANFGWHLSVRPDGRRFAYIEGGGGATESLACGPLPRRAAKVSR